MNICTKLMPSFTPSPKMYRRYSQTARNARGMCLCAYLWVSVVTSDVIGDSCPGADDDVIHLAHIMLWVSRGPLEELGDGGQRIYRPILIDEWIFTGIDSHVPWFRLFLSKIIDENNFKGRFVWWTKFADGTQMCAIWMFVWKLLFRTEFTARNV